MFCEFWPNLDKCNKIVKDITAAKELKTTTANQTAHQKTRSSSVFFDIFISRGRLVSVTEHYLPIFMINACHNHTCVNLCTSFLSQLEPVLHQPCQSHQLDTKLHQWAQWLPADWRHLVHCIGLTPRAQILHGLERWIRGKPGKMAPCKCWRRKNFPNIFPTLLLMPLPEWQ